LEIAVSLLLVLILWCGISLRHIIVRMALIVPFGLGAAVLMPLSMTGGESLQWLGLTLSTTGLHQAVRVILQMLGANLLLTYLLATTPLFDLMKALRVLKVPLLLIELMSLMLRYFFLLADEARSMLKAQRARGMKSEGWIWSRRAYIRFGELLGVLFIRAMKRSEKIYLSIQSRGGFQTELDTVHNPASTKDRSMTAIAIETVGVSYKYSNESAHVLKNISIRIQTGSKVALMGPNGAGKSTLISLLNGLEKPSAGKIRVFGVDIAPDNRAFMKQRIGVVFQDPDDQIFSTTVEEDVAFGPKNLGLSHEEVEERVSMALSSVGMRELGQRSPFELSYGQKRRVAIAGVLAMRPDIVILDEPMAFLDPKGRDELQSLLEAMHLMGITLIVATHDVDFAAEWADTIVILKNGEIMAQGEPDLLFNDEIVHQASLHLPRLSRPFRLLKGVGEDLKPKTVRQASQMIWRLMMDRFNNG